MPALSRLRLIAESDAVESIPGGGQVPAVKLYELVAGARLTLRGRTPGEEGVLLAAVQSPRGRRFPFVSPVRAGADSTIEIRIPYPSVAGLAAGESALVEGEILLEPRDRQPRGEEGVRNRRRGADPAAGDRPGRDPERHHDRHRMDIALVTFAGAPALDPDDEPLVPALAALGVTAAPVPWDDPDFDWSAPRIALLRSTWDYHHRYTEFIAWARAVASRTRLVNPLAVVEWNTHKGHYLETLAARGAPVVPTVLVRAGESLDLAALLADRGWMRAVIKPAVSADSFATMRVSAGDPVSGLDHLAAHRDRDMLVQPFLESVEEDGERCLVFIGGELSHAVRKRSLFLGGRHAGPEGVPVPPAPDEAAAARRILDLAGFGPLPYARVDLTRDAEGAPVLLELELVEPTLFLRTAPEAAEKLASLLADALDDRRR